MSFKRITSAVGGLVVGAAVISGLTAGGFLEELSANIERGWSSSTADSAATDELAVHRQLPPPAGGNSSPQVSELIAALTVVDELPDVPGYERKCGSLDGCVFGTAWTDDSTAPGAHNGCDSRNDVLGAQLRAIEYKPNTRECKVLSGTLDDPYTGRVIQFTSGKTTSSEVQIDHIYPLSRSWHAGAAQWPQERRVAFANDIDSNLLAVDGRTNNSKSDSGLDSWLPPNPEYACQYVIQYLTVAAKYQLLITQGDVDVALSTCRS